MLEIIQLNLTRDEAKYLEDVIGVTTALIANATADVPYDKEDMVISERVAKDPQTMVNISFKLAKLLRNIPFDSPPKL